MKLPTEKRKQQDGLKEIKMREDPLNYLLEMLLQEQLIPKLKLEEDLSMVVLTLILQLNDLLKI